MTKHKLYGLANQSWSNLYLATPINSLSLDNRVGPVVIPMVCGVKQAPSLQAGHHMSLLIQHNACVLTSSWHHLPKLPCSPFQEDTPPTETDQGAQTKRYNKYQMRGLQKTTENWLELIINMLFLHYPP